MHNLGLNLKHVAICEPLRARNCIYYHDKFHAIFDVPSIEIDYKLSPFMTMMLVESKSDLTMQELISLGIVNQKLANKVATLFSRYQKIGETNFGFLGEKKPESGHHVESLNIYSRKSSTQKISDKLMIFNDHLNFILLVLEVCTLQPSDDILDYLFFDDKACQFVLSPKIKVLVGDQFVINLVDNCLKDMMKPFEMQTFFTKSNYKMNFLSCIKDITDLEQLDLDEDYELLQKGLNLIQPERYFDFIMSLDLDMIQIKSTIQFISRNLVTEQMLQNALNVLMDFETDLSIMMMVFERLNRLLISKIEAWKVRFNPKSYRNHSRDTSYNPQLSQQSGDFEMDGPHFREYLNYMLRCFCEHSEIITQESLKYVINLIAVVNSYMSTTIFEILKENEDLTEYLEYLQIQSVYFEQYHSPKAYYSYMLRSDSQLKLSDSGMVLKFLSLNSLLLAEGFNSKG